jgi:beta-phosphoglucomutase
MPDVLLLELDGVLLDLLAPRRDALRQALAAEDIRIDEDVLAELVATHGFAAAAVAAASRAHVHLDPTGLDLIVMRAERLLETRLQSGATMVPGAAAFVDRVRTRARLALVTISPRRRVESALSLGGLTDAFETIVTADDVLSQKPDPECIRLALDRLGRRRPLGPARVIALEGTREGIRAARASRIGVIAVGAMPAHVAVDADGYLESLEDATLDRLGALVRPDGGARVE